MEYAPSTCRARAQRGGTPFQTTLGPYDYWAIEYAYKPIAPADRGSAELQRIAARSTEPLLAYGTDEDQPSASTPRRCSSTWATTRWPLPPSAWRSRATCSSARKRASSRPTRLRRAAPLGGLCVARRRPRRGRAGAPDRRRAHAARLPRQRARPAAAGAERPAAPGARPARAHVLAADGLAVSPALQRRLAPDFLERADDPGAAPPTTRAAAAARPAARAAGPVDERRRGRAHARQRRQGRPAGRGVPAVRALCSGSAATSGASWRQGGIIAPRAANCSATVNRLATACCAPARRPGRCAQPAARAGACAAGALDKALERRAPGAETRAHLPDSADAEQALAARLDRAGV